MQLIDKINKLKKTEKTFFTIEDLQKVLNLKKDSLKKTLKCMRKKNIIRRLARGVYIIPEQGMDIKKIASQLFSPYAYISFESALSIYSVIDQIPYAVTMATYKTSKKRAFFETEIILRKIKKSLFFGYKLEGGLLIAEPEKALLDTFYLKSKGLASLDGVEFNLGDLSKTKLLRMSKKFPLSVQKDVKKFFG